MVGLFVGLYSLLNVLKSWPNCVRPPQGNGTGWAGEVAGNTLGGKGEIVGSPKLCSYRPDWLTAQPACALNVNKNELHLRGRTTRSLLSSPGSGTVPDGSEKQWIRSVNKLHRSNTNVRC